MTKTTFDRILDLLGSAGAGVALLAASAPTLGIPAWLAAAGAVVAYVAGKSATPGVPFLAKAPPGDAKP